MFLLHLIFAIGFLYASAADPCPQPIKSGPCLALIPRYAFDSDQGKCVEFTYGGCQANDNNFETIEKCQSECEPANVCSMPLEVGPCKAAMSSLAGFPDEEGRFVDERRLITDGRYGSKDEQRTCVEFTYGGCRGNANNFDTLDACKKRCPSNPYYKPK